MINGLPLFEKIKLAFMPLFPYENKWLFSYLEYKNVANSYINLHKKTFLTSKIFPRLMIFLIFAKSLLVFLRQYKRCNDLIFCMNIHNHIVHHYCKNCMSSFSNSALIVKNLKTPKFTFSGLLWKNETSYSYIFWNQYGY